MKTTRRAFLQRFGIGLAAATALIGVSEYTLDVLPLHEAGKFAAGKYLVMRWREHMRGKTAGECPSEVHVSLGLYDAFDADLISCYRWCDTADLQAEEQRPALMFRSAKLRAKADIATWEGLRFVA